MLEATSVVGLLERASASSDTGLRFLDRNERSRFHPWSEIWQRARSVASGLRRAGIARGDRIALVYPTSMGFAEAFFGTLVAGAVPVPLYPPVRLHRLEEYLERTVRMLRAVSARMVLADRTVRPILGPAVVQADPELGCRMLDELDEGAAAETRPDPSDLALIQFSSGTTVEPKPVALSHRAVVEQVVALNGHWPDTDDCTHSGVSWLPLYHDMGLIGCVISALERPGMMTLIPPELFLARPAVWLRAISTSRATISVAPNFAYGLCVEKIKDDQLDGIDLTSWRVGLCGAEPVVPRVLRRFLERFEPLGLSPEALTPVYGLSEATLAVTFAELHRPFASRSFDRDALSRSGHAREAPDGVELVTVGRPIEGVALRVVADDGSDLPECRVGRVLVRGPSIMEGYYDRPEATAEALTDGWLDTGDLGFLLDDQLYLTGRAKDVLILRGRSHSPSEVEAAVDEVDGVRTGCSVAVSWLPDGADGEVLLLLVEAGRDFKDEDTGSLTRACRSAVRSGTGLEVDRIEVLAPGTLPRTSSGKLRRAESLRLYLSGELAAPRKMSSWRLAGAALRGSLEIARLNRRTRG
jgi:acyl-CoA synthetase (AMP-forming)/AMP-acid ligase II